MGAGGRGREGREIKGYNNLQSQYKLITGTLEPLWRSSETKVRMYVSNTWIKKRKEKKGKEAKGKGMRAEYTDLGEAHTQNLMNVLLWQNLGIAVIFHHGSLAAITK